MEDKYYSELVSIRMERAGELLKDAYVVFPIMMIFMWQIRKKQSNRLKMRSI